jgi:hypothetical protein
MSLCSTEGLGGSLLGPQDLDRWLVRTVQALQESMQDVQGRLQILESKPQPPEQVSVSPCTTPHTHSSRSGSHCNRILCVSTMSSSQSLPKRNQA